MKSHQTSFLLSKQWTAGIRLRDKSPRRRERRRDRGRQPPRTRPSPEPRATARQVAEAPEGVTLLTDVPYREGNEKSCIGKD